MGYRAAVFSPISGAGDSGLRGDRRVSIGSAVVVAAKTTLTACTVNGLTAECGNVWVPQDWAHPAGPTMPLEVVVLPATATTHPAAPLFVLGGWNGDNLGFGGAVLSDMTWAAQAFRQLNQTMDLVFIEQRGTPGSGLQRYSSHVRAACWTAARC